MILEKRKSFAMKEVTEKTNTATDDRIRWLRNSSRCAQNVMVPSGLRLYVCPVWVKVLLLKFLYGLRLKVDGLEV